MLASHVVFIGVLLLNIVVVALLQHFRKRFPPSLTVAQQNIVLGPFAFVITLYAFLLSFVVINLWQSFSQAQRTAVIEAETVAVLYQLTESFPGAQVSRQTLTQYVRSVVQDEWPAMAEGKSSAKTEALYNQIWQEVRDLVPSTTKEQLLYAELLDQLSILATSRRDRLLMVGGSIPHLMWTTLGYGGLLVLSGLYYLNIGSPKEQTVIDFTVIAMLFATVYLGIELSGPFRGNVKISPRTFERIGAYMAQLPP
jgi:uncharacterized protein DUF4239